MSADRWLDALADMRRASDLDAIRELGEWMTGGGCTCYGVELDHGGTQYAVVLTDHDIDATSPTSSTRTVDAGVYRDNMYDGDTRWCLASDVPLDELPAVLDWLLALNADPSMPLDDWSAYDPEQWRPMVAAARATHDVRTTRHPSILGGPVLFSATCSCGWNRLEPSEPELDRLVAAHVAR